MGAWNRKTNKEFLDELKDKGIEYTPLEEYAGASTEILFKCERCGHEWNARPTNILSGRGCPECKKSSASERFSMAHDEFVRRAGLSNPNVDVIGKYINNKTKVKVRCRKHGVEWSAHPDSVLRGSGCRECMKEKISQKNGMTDSEFTENISNTAPYVDIIGPYVNAHTGIKVRCRVHNVEYSTTPDLLSRGYGICPACSMTSGEHAVAAYLEENGIEYVYQYTPEDGGVGKKRYDFYLKSINTIIEYDGIQHYEPVSNFGGEETYKYTKSCDAIKDDYCRAKNIRLLRIPYYEKDIPRFLRENGIQ